jgi:hypothetical protein
MHEMREVLAQRIVNDVNVQLILHHSPLHVELVGVGELVDGRIDLAWQFFIGDVPQPAQVMFTFDNWQTWANDYFEETPSYEWRGHVEILAWQVMDLWNENESAIELAKTSEQIGGEQDASA